MTTDRSASATTEALRTLTKQIAAMKSMSLSELAQLHVSLFGKYPQTHNRERLVSLLARKLQEAQEGGLSRRERLRIIELRAHMPPSWEEKLSISGLDGRKAKPRPRPPSRATAQPSRATMRKKRRRDPRLPPPGAVLGKLYEGRQHDVMVGESTFVYEGRSYRSLSAVAVAITGQQWNGFRFFDLVGAPAKESK